MEQQLSMFNLALCDAYGTHFEIAKSHQLTLISKQHTQFNKHPRAEQAAHTAYMIRSLRPFASNNLRTAMVYLCSVYPKMSTERKQQLAGLIKHGADVKTISQVLV